MDTHNTKKEQHEHSDDDSIQYEEERTEKSIDEEELAETVEVKFAKTKEDLKKCAELQKEYLDGWQRAKADFINYKKDDAKRFQELGKIVIEDCARDIFLVLDSFYLARQYEMPKNVAKGFAMIQGQLEDVLRKRGFTAIAVKAGDEFDPRIHESIGEVSSQHPLGSVAEEAQKGYEVNGRVLRPARVRLSKCDN
ncbi:MAG: nucleotide exchange factor GrpE [Patescibacteria group bacterium]